MCGIIALSTANLVNDKQNSLSITSDTQDRVHKGRNAKMISYFMIFEACGIEA